jgi:hypothetical protein
MLNRKKEIAVKERKAKRRKDKGLSKEVCNTLGKVEYGVTRKLLRTAPQSCEPNHQAHEFAVKCSPSICSCLGIEAE